MKSWPMIPGVPAAGHVTGGFWHPGRAEGCGKCEPAPPRIRPRVFTVRSSDVARCPRGSLSPSHYEPDGTCACRPEQRSEHG